MDCRNVQDRMTAYLAQELVPVEQEHLLAHLAICDGCRQETETFRETWEMLGTWQDVSPSPALEARILANLGRIEPSVVRASQPRLQPWLVATSALVAALLSTLSALLLPYEKAVALCGDALRSFEPLARISDAAIYFLVGSTYGLVPLLLVGLVSGRLIRGQVLTQGLLTGCLFVVLVTPYLLAA